LIHFYKRLEDVLQQLQPGETAPECGLLFRQVGLLVGGSGDGAP